MLKEMAVADWRGIEKDSLGLYYTLNSSFLTKSGVVATTHS